MLLLINTSNKRVCILDIFFVDLSILQPSQLYISKSKCLSIQKWFNPLDLSNFEPIPIKKLKDKIIYTDGHTRAYMAYKAGLSKIPVYWDTDDLDWTFYWKCVEACEKECIYTIADLGRRVVDEADYNVLWRNWCEELAKILENRD